MQTFLERLLNYYNLNFEEYQKLIKDVTFEDIPSFEVFKNINETVSYLYDCVKANRKILIYGDYDCDGIMSTSIIYNMFQSINYKVGFYIPSREKDGYGLNISKIDFFKNLGYEVIICVDNGITLVDEVNYLHEKNMECVILDHHLLQDELPNTKYIIHPQLSSLPINTSAGAVSFIFSTAFLNKINPYLLTLGSISIISDLMSLKDYNRTIVRLGLNLINEYKFPSIMSLIGETEDEITENDIAINIAPKINAVCRVMDDDSIFNVVRLFTSLDEIKISKYGKWINLVNEKRKEILNDALLNNSNIDLENNAIVEIIDMKEGLASLIANKYLSKYNKPTFILVKNHDVYKGSVRSKENFNVVNCFSYLGDLLLTSGGHSCAGGFSLKVEDFEKFKNKVNEYANNCPSSNNENKQFVEINLSEINFENYQIINTFRPFGHDFAKPIFKISNFKTSSLVLSKDKKHIITKLSMNSSLIYFNFDNDLFNYDFVNFYGTFELNKFKNLISVQFKVIDYDKNN